MKHIKWKSLWVISSFISVSSYPLLCEIYKHKLNSLEWFLVGMIIYASLLFIIYKIHNYFSDDK